MIVKVLNIIDDKTFKAVATSYKQHPKYKKYVVSHKNFLVHYEDKAVKVGDQVEVFETRPRSKRKRWELGSLLNKL